MAKAATVSKPLTKSEIMSQMAEKVGISRKQTSLFFEDLAGLAYKQAKNSFIIPGLGKLDLKERSARKMVMRFGPDQGKEMTVPQEAGPEVQDRQGRQGLDSRRQEVNALVLREASQPMPLIGASQR